LTQFNKTIFNQLIDFLPKRDFYRLVEKHNGNRYVKSFSCWDQFLIMLFAQLTFRNSLRDVVICLNAITEKTYHLGIKGKVSRSTLAEANEKRDWRIFQDFGYILIAKARKMYEDERLITGIENKVYAIDASVIDLCLSVFPWAKFKTTKAGVKLHLTYDIQCNIPYFVVLTEANVHEINTLTFIEFEKDSFYILDRGYLDFEKLYLINKSGAFFVTRSKTNTKFRRIKSFDKNKEDGILADQEIVLSSTKGKKDYPEKLRRIKFRDPETKKVLTFLTNNFELPAKDIARLYKARWQIELFFKWIKQHLKVKKFYGTSENAVRIQIWVAIISFLLLTIAKKSLNSKKSIYNLLQIVNVLILEKKPIFQVFSEVREPELVRISDNLLNLKLN
jgi:hypothetical protein